MYEIIKKFLNDGGKCLLIEDSKPIGVVLSVEEYEKLKNGLSAVPAAKNPIEEAMAKEMDFPEALTEIADIEATDDVTLEDLGINELPY